MNLLFNILQICPKVPYPPVDGGSIATNNITQGLLKQGHNVKVLALSTPKYSAEKAFADKHYVEKTNFDTVFVDTGFNPASAFFSLVRNRSYNVERFHSRHFEKKLVETLGKNKFDIVLFESIYTAPYLPALRRITDAPALLRAHNVEQDIWRGNQALEKNPVKKAYFAALTKTLANYEKQVCNQFDGVLPITDEDKRKFQDMGCFRPMETIPFGIDIEKVTSSVSEEYPSVFHLGAMDWRPNQDAIRWFLDEVWSKIVKIFPNVKLYLAGRAMPNWLLNYKDANVEVVGEVENAYDFMASKSIMVVPLFSGSGMRIKIVEGMALGKTIISTLLGATGIKYRNGEQLLIAESKSDFIHWLTTVLSDESFCKQIGQNAKSAASVQFDNDIHLARLAEFCANLKSMKSSNSSSEKPIITDSDENSK